MQVRRLWNHHRTQERKMTAKPKAVPLAIEGPKPAIAAIAAHTQTDLKTGVKRTMKTAEQFVSFGQGNLEAFIKSSQVLATGLTDLSKHMAAHAQSAMDETAATMKAMTGVKSVKEAIELQTAFTKSYFEKTVAETSKLTEHSIKLAEAAYAPITARVTAAVETFSPNA
jgi:phasin family protein